MKKLYALLAAFVMLFALSGTAVAKTPKPGGSGGCTNCRIITVQTRYDTWAQDVTWPEGPVENYHWYTVRATIGSFYFYWPDGRRQNKISPFKTEVCYSFISQGANFMLFDGIKAHVSYRGDVHQNILPTIRVPDDGSRQNCATYTIPIRYRHWYGMGESPEIKATGSVVRHLRSDIGFTWRYGDSRVPYKYFHPLRDYVIRDWHKIVKAW